MRTVMVLVAWALALPALATEPASLARGAEMVVSVAPQAEEAIKLAPQKGPPAELTVCNRSETEQARYAVSIFPPDDMAPIPISWIKPKTCQTHPRAWGVTLGGGEKEWTAGVAFK